jgi:signal transduction histidine kinase
MSDLISIDTLPRLLLLAAIAAACVGFSAFWSNPRRRINRLFFTASIHVAVWLVCRYTATVYENLFMARVTAAVGSFVHFHLWLMKESVAQPTESFSRQVYRGRYWILIAAGIAVLCFSQAFIPTPSNFGGAAQHRVGYGYFIFIAGLIGLFITLCFETLKQVRTSAGVKRMELQLLLFGGSGCAIALVLLMGLRVFVDAVWLFYAAPVIVLGFYTTTALAITTSRVFDARQLMLVALQKASVLIIVTLVVVVTDALLGQAIDAPISLLITVAIGLWVAGLTGRAMFRLLRYYPEADKARQAAFTVAQSGRRVDELVREFESILKGWGQAEVAYIHSASRQALSGPSPDVPLQVMNSLRGLHWATPERLNRERYSESRKLIADFLDRNRLAVLVLEEGASLSVLIGVGVGTSRRPITYPQVKQLIELASIFESALERAHFSAKVQQTEQLATVGLLGASLAHEIRNPLVSIKTFVQLLPSHYHDAAFREKFFRLIGDEVTRIDQLTDQLLDLASPRAYSAELLPLHPVLTASMELVAAKASHRQVQLIPDLQATPDLAYTDGSAAKQVVLNLCFNAIQAVDSHGGEERWVRVSTRNVDSGIEMAVADSGPGIAAEIRPRLFQPFQTTKSTGFGLGLAICSDILSNLNATISVDPSESGRGATFRVIFPCRASS